MRLRPSRTLLFPVGVPRRTAQGLKWSVSRPAVRFGLSMEFFVRLATFALADPYVADTASTGVTG